MMIRGAHGGQGVWARVRHGGHRVLAMVRHGGVIGCHWIEFTPCIIYLKYNYVFEKLFYELQQTDIISFLGSSHQWLLR